MLDEPTNDLDLETLDLLQEVIADYDGTVLIVSHDRDFLDKTVTVTLGLDGSGNVDIVAGGYEDWVKRKNPTSAPAKAGALRASKTSSHNHPTPRPSGSPQSNTLRGAPSPGNKKLSFKHQRDLDRLPAEVDRLEHEIADAEKALHDPDLFLKHPEKFAELTKTIDLKRAEKDAAEERWLEVVELAEGLGR